jgi:drug/metabolite transporter (DMT)-like permease
MIRTAPGVFVLLWSTGFIGSKFGVQYAEPLTLLFWRMLLAAAFLGLMARMLGLPRLDAGLRRQQMLTGLMMHGCYLGGVFWSIRAGMPAGISSLIVGLQPILTVGLARLWLKERISPIRLGGTLLGLLGVMLVLHPAWDGMDPEVVLGSAPTAVPGIMVALVGISLGTVYQKHHGQAVNVVSGSFWQYVAATGCFLLMALLLEEGEVRWEWPLIAVLAWMVFGLSVGAVSLLLVLIRQGEASRVASLFYLVPPMVALESWLLFGEYLDGLQGVGMLLSLIGVAVVAKFP